MKKLWMTMILVSAFSLVAMAQSESETANASNRVEAQEEESGMTKLRADELPEGVKKALADPQYKGWLINKATHDKKRDEYEVELKNGADTKKVRFNGEGNRLDD